MPTETTTSTASATQRWEACVEEKIKRGHSRFKAVTLVAAECPKLHAAYLAEANGQSATTADDARNSDAIAAWKALVDGHVARGMSRTKAVQVAATQNAGLHAAYIREYNSQARERQRC
jgi:hypothetical protein